VITILAFVLYEGLYNDIKQSQINLANFSKILGCGDRFTEVPIGNKDAAFNSALEYVTYGDYLAYVFVGVLIAHIILGIIKVLHIRGLIFKDKEELANEDEFIGAINDEDDDSEDHYHEDEEK
jgi:hypothetical protein